MTERAYLRIGELANQAGVSVSTIKYYIREGLLPPPPLKTGRTMGYYDEAYLERLKLVRRLREEHFLPVRVIRTIVADQAPRPRSPAETELLMRVAPGVVKQLAGAAAGMTLAEAGAHYRLDQEQLGLLKDMGLLGEDGENLSASDVELLEALAHGEAAGLTRDRFPIEGLGNYVELLGELARREVRSFMRHAAEGIPEEEVARMSSIAVAATLPMLAVIRKKLILRALRAELDTPKKESP